MANLVSNIMGAATGVGEIRTGIGELNTKVPSPIENILNTKFGGAPLDLAAKLATLESNSSSALTEAGNIKTNIESTRREILDAIKPAPLEALRSWVVKNRIRGLAVAGTLATLGAASYLDDYGFNFTHMQEWWDKLDLPFIKEGVAPVASEAAAGGAVVVDPAAASFDKAEEGFPGAQVDPTVSGTPIEEVFPGPVDRK